MQQHDLLDLTSEQGDRQSFAGAERSLRVTNVSRRRAPHHSCVAALGGLAVCRGEDVIVVVHRHGGNPVSSFGEEALDLPPGGEVPSRMEVGVPEVAQPHSFPPQQLRRYPLAADDLGIEARRRRRVKIGVGEGVVTELEPRIEPHLQQGDTVSVRRAAPLAAEAIQSVFVDEANHRHLPRPDLGEQLPCHDPTCGGIHGGYGAHG